MQCGRCLKDMERTEGERVDQPGGGPTFLGRQIQWVLMPDQRTPENIAYNNRQLGRYADGNGECKVGLCYECEIDIQFGRHDTVIPADRPDGR